MSEFRLNEQEQEIVELIDQGYNRYDIANLMDMSSSVVREVVRKMCETFGCKQHDLPDAVKARASELPRSL